MGELRAALRVDGGGHDVDVPCGSCTACCTSSQFVHIAPDEVDTLARIPKALLFPAPGLPRGHVLMGYDERGHCPMLVDGGCSIYDHRPRTCRTYDCRVFAATGVELVEADKARIAERVRRWRFTGGDVDEREALEAAGRFVSEHRAELGLTTSTQVAVAAVRVHELFAGGADPDVDDVRSLLGRRPR